jgi:hypothetical protein
MGIGQPGSVNNIAKPRPEQAIAREIRDLKRRVAQLEARRPIFCTQFRDVLAVAGAIPTVVTGVYTATMTVPSGYTSAIVMMRSSYTANRSGGVAGVLFIRNTIGSTVYETENIALAASTQPGWVSQVSTETLTGLSGGSTFPLTIAVSSSGTWDSGTGVVRIRTFITYLR